MLDGFGGVSLAKVRERLSGNCKTRESSSLEEDELAHNEEYVVTGADRKHTTVLVRVRNVVEVVK